AAPSAAEETKKSWTVETNWRCAGSSVTVPEASSDAINTSVGKDREASRLVMTAYPSQHVASDFWLRFRGPHMVCGFLHHLQTDQHKHHLESTNCIKYRL